MSDISEVTVGIITRPHGLRGMLKVNPTTDDPTRFKHLEEVGLRLEQRVLGIFRIEEVRVAHSQVVVKFHGIDTVEAAERLRGAEVIIPRAACLPTDENQYYHFDLIGLEVLTSDGRPLGRISDIMNFPANDVWEIRDPHGREILLPAIDSVIQKVDIERRQVIVTPIAGLLDDLEDPKS